MTWFMRGQSYACCSCSLGCPCAAGEMETKGSDGCAAVQIIDILAGQIDGTDVSGAKIAAVVDWPGAMMAGNGTGRLYFDVDTAPKQREALEALISGKLGGGFSRIPELVTETLTPLLAPIRIETSADDTLITVGQFGQARVKPIRTPGGDDIGLQGAGGFRDDVKLAIGHGSWWHDPQLAHWEGGGYAEQSEFEWRG